VTRAREQAAELVELLEEKGANVVLLPMIEIAPPESFDSLDALIDGIESWHWLVFTSTNGVDSFFSRLFEKGRDVRALGSAHVAAVGEATSERLRSFGIVPDVVPEKFQASAILPLLPAEQTGVRTAIIRAKEGREELIDELRARGGEVHLAVAYETRPSQYADDALRKLVASDAIDCVTFTSGSTVKSFFAKLTGEEKSRLAARAVFASIGPSTSATLAKTGAPNTIEARQATVEALCEAVVEHFAK
jgi:Uroporphyrinogen-III synthase